ncbi:MAG: hypothetical protein KY444_11930, partial [Gemmatimonadetes bacterium]|nr:hypothetical protein [Gemmatimonadota bacterium]
MDVRSGAGGKGNRRTISGMRATGRKSQVPPGGSERIIPPGQEQVGPAWDKHGASAPQWDILRQTCCGRIATAPATRPAPAASWRRMMFAEEKRPGFLPNPIQERDMTQDALARNNVK